MAAEKKWRENRERKKMDGKLVIGIEKKRKMRERERERGTIETTHKDRIASINDSLG